MLAVSRLLLFLDGRTFSIILFSVSIHHSSWRIHPHHGHLCKWNGWCALTCGFTVNSPHFFYRLFLHVLFSPASLLCNLLLLPFSLLQPPFCLSFYSPTSFIYFKTDTLLLLKLHPLILLEGWALISCEWSCFWCEEREWKWERVPHRLKRNMHRCWRSFTTCIWSDCTIGTEKLWSFNAGYKSEPELLGKHWGIQYKMW